MCMSKRSVAVNVFRSLVAAAVQAVAVTWLTSLHVDYNVEYTKTPCTTTAFTTLP